MNNQVNVRAALAPKCRLFWLLSFILRIEFAYMSGSVHGAIIHVPAEQPSIQAGIDASVNGDTVLVADGTYSGAGNQDIDFGGRLITLTSENGSSSCIIDCQSSGRGLYFHLGETHETLVDGFTICHGYVNYENGAGILCSAASPTIRNCVISGNSLNYGCGAGICCTESASPIISDCIITENLTHYPGTAAGVYCSDSSPYLLNCTIAANSAAGRNDHCGGIKCSNSSPIIANCSIIGNHSYASAGGLSITSASAPVITNCAITGNYAHGNSGGGEGGGVYCSESAPIICNCTITGNVSQTRGGGIWFSEPSSVFLSNNTISGNIATYGGGIYCSATSAVLTITNCTIKSNRGSDNGGGLYGGGMLITNSLIVANTSLICGGFYCLYANSVMSNCTLSQNSSQWGSSGAVYCSSSLLSIINCILWDDIPAEIEGYPIVGFSDIEGGYPGAGNFNADPLFAPGPLGEWYLSQIAAGQSTDSPCINSGSAQASDICFPLSDQTVCMNELTTRIDAQPDSDQVDVGFHYQPTAVGTPTNTPTISVTGTPPATTSPLPSMTGTPVESPSPAPPSQTATRSPTPSVTTTPTPTAILTTGVQLEMPAHYFSSNDLCFLKAFVSSNLSTPIDALPFAIVLDLETGVYWFYPHWTEYPPAIDYDVITVLPGTMELDIIEPFYWPETGNQSFDRAHFYGGLLTPDLSALYGEPGYWDFGWGQ